MTQAAGPRFPLSVQEKHHDEANPGSGHCSDGRRGAGRLRRGVQPANRTLAGPSGLAAPRVPPAGEPRPTCCSEGTDRGLLLAEAGGHEARPQGNGQPAKDGRKPNILVIWGDDIGISNISAYSDGLMGYTTPNIDRIAKEGHSFPALLRGAELHRGPCGVSHRPAWPPHRLDQGGLSRRSDGHEPTRPLHRRIAQEPGLQHGAVRQEPRRRPQPIAADSERFRRVLRQPLSPQRRGRARASRLSEGPGLPRQVRPARRAQVQGHRQR